MPCVREKRMPNSIFDFSDVFSSRKAKMLTWFSLSRLPFSKILFPFSMHALRDIKDTFPNQASRPILDILTHFQWDDFCGQGNVALYRRVRTQQCHSRIWYARFFLSFIQVEVKKPTRKLSNWMLFTFHLRDTTWARKDSPLGWVSVNFNPRKYTRKLPFPRDRETNVM